MPSVATALAFLVLAVLAGPVTNIEVNQTKEVTMNSKIPELKFEFVKLTVPTLGMICRALAWWSAINPRSTEDAS